MRRTEADGNYKMLTLGTDGSFHYQADFCGTRVTHLSRCGLFGDVADRFEQHYCRAAVPVGAAFGDRHATSRFFATLTKTTLCARGFASRAPSAP
jgi:hypothetical protein